MPLNRDYIEARVREINDAISLLRDLSSRDFDSLSLYERLSMRYLVIQLVEAASGICLHILIELFGEAIDSMPGCFTRLGEKGVLEPELASRLASSARLRNLLVHRYWSVDDRRVFESVKRGLADFEEFVRRVRGL
ncbi:DUF86 domain-containing protein [Infirmifilum lucidum]|uniref:DUF86 domain-containing protein n=1 Tax=Infirmifilum lucidum TaxID=2776706 RepID=A0A7L9FH06_9CREN|nr:DUF86 domain-containing protein [Infirmifilum lucidum]QOJ78911.1 DUF86 domain-containing protein [Infirmifilum lucidum]